MMGLVRPWVAPLLGNCSWVALLEISAMMLSRDFCFLHLSCMSKTGLLGFKILLCTGRIRDWSNLRKQLNVNMSRYQVCSMEVNRADIAASHSQPSTTGAGLILLHFPLPSPMLLACFELTHFCWEGAAGARSNINA